jgi:hypothetical protein
MCGGTLSASFCAYVNVQGRVMSTTNTTPGRGVGSMSPLASNRLQLWKLAYLARMSTISLSLSKQNIQGRVPWAPL